MVGRDPGRALILAGGVVTLIGLAIALVRAFHLPGYWTVVAVGLTLMVAGALWRRRSP